MYSYYKCYVTLPHGAVGWSAVCECGISWSYSLTFYIYNEQKGNTKTILIIIITLDFLQSRKWPILKQYTLLRKYEYIVDIDYCM